MIEQESEVQTIEQRLGKLERENRLLKRGVCVVLLAITSAMLMGQGRPIRTVEADKFVLKDANGLTRAEMSIWEKEPLLAFYDLDGKRTLGLSSTVLALGQSSVKGSSYRTKLGIGGLSFVDSDGKPQVFLSAGRACLRVFDKEGFSAAFGSTDIVSPKTGEKSQTSAASILLFDKDGVALWKAP
jgi:hypothetical protein